MRHAHSGARVVGRDVGCGWTGVGSEWIFFSLFNFQTNLISLLYLFFAREISLCSHRSLFARRFVLSFDFDYSE